MSQSSIKAAVAALLTPLSGIGRVDNRYGGLPQWIATARPHQAYWVVTVGRIHEARESMPTTNLQTLTLIAEGWMPMDFGLDTQSTWETLTDSVLSTLRTHITLSGNAFNSEPPQAVENDLNLASDGQKDVVCHHMRVEWRVIVRIRFTNQS